MNETETLRPFIKWAGGKEKELPVINRNLPTKINNFYEPFVGGGAVFFSLSETEISGKRFINDKSEELILLYKMIASNSKSFFSYLEDINKNWLLIGKVVDNNKDELLGIYKTFKNNGKSSLQLRDHIDAFIIQHKDEFNGMLELHFNVLISKFFQQLTNSCVRKLSRVSFLEDDVGSFGDANILKNIETAFKAAFYTHFRYLYNNKDYSEIATSIDESKGAAIYYFLREFCYASMFRYNSEGKFNVPYGGMGYNNKDFGAKISYLESKSLRNYLKNTTISLNDFEQFVEKYQPQKGDFIFLDPPYDTDFSNYAKNEFNKNDQVRLSEFLKKTPAHFMLVIKETPFISSLYKCSEFKVIKFEKTYMVNFQNRNDRNVTHLLITNY